jgi:anti-sigma regulatory factor (Ser/Thr protein kinase)
MANKNFSICDIVAEINHKLKATLPSVIFLAACLTELNYEKGTLTVWNGGIPDMLVVGKNGGIKNRLPSRHLPLGVVDNNKLDLDVEICNVEDGDRIYIYSDGVIETSNPNEEMFGQERFETFFRNKYDHERILDKIKSDLEAFRGDVPQQDDITIVEITCAPLSFRSLDDESTLRKKAAYDGWNLSLKFDAETLRTIDVSSFLIKIIEEDIKLREHKENVYLIMKELVTNALEHGLLKLPSEIKKSIEGFEQYVIARQEALDALSEGWIKVNLEFFPIEKGGKLLVRVEDTGTGFNYQQRLSDLADNVSFSGRGIPLVRSICKEVTYHGNGNRVQAVYAF